MCITHIPTGLDQTREPYGVHDMTEEEAWNIGFNGAMLGDPRDEIATDPEIPEQLRAAALQGYDACTGDACIGG